MTEFERSLAALSPARGLVNRDRLMFEAGRRSAIAPNRLRWAWPAIATSLAAVALGQSLELSRRPEARVVERVVVVREPAVEPHKPADLVVILSRSEPVPPSPDLDRFDASATNTYLQLSRRIERFGFEGLPDPSPLLTLSAGNDGPPGFSPNAPDVLQRYGLDQILSPGGPL